MPRFPDGFAWGTAASAHQAEGGTPADDWWDFEREPGRVAGGRPSEGNAFATRYAEDFTLLAELGLRHHRLSVDWARIEPAEGRIDPSALDHYRRMVDAAHDAGLVPWVNLHHFVNPRWFAARGAFTREENLPAWRRFVATVADALAPRGVTHWHTVNEPFAYAAASYLGGRFPPCLVDPGAFRAVLTNLYRAHAIGGEVLKDRGAGLVASINALTEVVPADPASDADVALATMIDTFQNELAVEGQRSGLLPWPDGPVEVPGLRGAADLFGVNWYAGIVADSRAPFDYATYVPPGETRRSQLGQAPWAEGFHRLLLRLRDARLGTPMLVTENGLGTDDDGFRVAFLRDHLDALGRAIAEGADVRGYFHWTSVDNFEWTHGYTAQFGLIAAEGRTGARRPKPSAAFLGAVARANALEADP